MSARPAPRRFFRPTWAEIDLAALRENLKSFRRALGRRGLMFVVKANAYGHGAAECAKAAQAAGLAQWLGVSSVEEGVALREAGLKLPILVLGSLFPFESFLAAAEHELTPTVASLESAKRFTAACDRLKRRVRCHLKVETGMGRIGMTPKTAVEASKQLLSHKLARLEGVYTHLACAESDGEFTRRQLGLFSEAARGIEKLAGRSLLKHAANSAAALKHPESRYDLARPGLAIYGLMAPFKPVLSLKSKIVFLKKVPAGTQISYCGSYRTRRPTRIATIPAGYADGVSRSLSNRGHALVGGRRCPIVGRVTMDMLMLDVTDVPEAKVGDDAVLIGRQGKEQITAGELAQLLGTIPYEISCAVSSRVPRVYLP